MRKSSSESMQIDNYDEYRLSFKEYIRYILQGVAIILIIGWLFYRSIIGAILASPLLYPYLRRTKSRLAAKRKWQLCLEFNDGITSLSSALRAGYSAENAFEEALKDLMLLYGGEAIIIREFKRIVNQVNMNIPVEKALADFAERTGIDDILSFSEVFATAKRTGGDLVSIIKGTSAAISGKTEVKREIITMLAAKKYESNILKVMPPGIILYLQLSSPGFLSPLYHNIAGIIIMTVILGLYLGAYVLINRISSIEV
jgi:tight adherence protein B